MLGSSKFAYGWIGHRPNRAEVDKTLNVALRGIHKTSNRNGSKNLKCVLEGAVIDPTCIIATRLAGVAARAIAKKNGHWLAGKETLAGNIRQTMESLGWKEDGECR